MEFEVNAAKEIKAGNFDLVCIFDALTIWRSRGSSSAGRKDAYPEGTFMVVEPMAADSLGENLNLHQVSFTDFLPQFAFQLLGLKR